MKHLGTKRIETERLILRKFTIQDAEPMFRNWAGDPEVTKYLTWPAHSNIEISRKIIGIWVKEYEKPDHYQWCMELKELGEVIGGISVVNIRESIDAVEVGYCIGSRFWGQGITTEAFRALLPFFFDEMEANRVEAKHDVSNPGSGKVMAKCGLIKEGVIRQGSRNNTGLCDTAIYGLVKEDWDRQKTTGENCD